MLRDACIQQLQAQTFDVLIIGAGASGLGCALDAASRGLSVAIVDAHDFCSGTSSKSSKLIHGGVRYLELAVKHGDLQQLQLVREALKERTILLRNAPEIVKPLRLLTPCASSFSAAYYWAGLKCYDALAASQAMQPSHYLGAAGAKNYHDFLQPKSAQAMVAYSDGQFDDCALGFAILEQAQQYGAIALNYAAVTKISDNYTVHLHDSINDQAFTINARSIVNCAGPFSDQVRALMGDQTMPRIQMSIGSHICVKKKHWPFNEGMLIPKTTDGRVLFILPWLDHVIIGTTDQKHEANGPVSCTQEQANYLIQHANHYLKYPIRISDIRSAWAGVRPLLVPDATTDSAKIVREHRVFSNNKGAFHLCGGKWTSYRLMAEDCIDQVCDYLGTHSPCTTKSIPLPKKQFGNNWEEICENAVQDTGAQFISDILARRSRMAFLDIKQSCASIQTIASLLKPALHWTGEIYNNHIEQAQANFDQEFLMH